nr:hypothetical protein [uncultured Carboxylicivirga sp.]
MKTQILIIFFIVQSVFAGAQSTGLMSDAERLSLSVWLPEQTETIPAGATSLLYNKMLKAATESGLSAISNGSRFILTANSVVLDKSITSTAPAMVAVNLELTFYIGDGLEGKMYESYSINLKGLGKSENKAYLSALKNIRTDSPEMTLFLHKGKEKIINYFNTRCDFILKEAYSLEALEHYEEAILLLTGVPQVCKECFEKSITAAEPIYQKYINYSGQQKLAEAKAMWFANQNMAAANAISVLLGEISPNAKCYQEVENLYEDVAKRIKEVDGRDWDFKQKQHELETDKVRAMRDVGVAYGEGQAKEIQYNNAGWWPGSGK